LCTCSVARGTVSEYSANGLALYHFIPNSAFRSELHTTDIEVSTRGVTNLAKFHGISSDSPAAGHLIDHAGNPSPPPAFRVPACRRLRFLLSARRNLQPHPRQGRSKPALFIHRPASGAGDSWPAGAATAADPHPPTPQRPGASAAVAVGQVMGSWGRGHSAASAAGEDAVCAVAHGLSPHGRAADGAL
jgi:hypothetical protein